MAARKNLMFRRQLGWRVFITSSVATGMLLVAVGAARADTDVARADPGVGWNEIAACESSGNWSIHTSQFTGGLQILSSTWVAYGGTQYAPQAYQASKSQQIAVAERILAGQGIRAWPVCGAHAHDGYPAPQDGHPSAHASPQPRDGVPSAHMTGQHQTGVAAPASVGASHHPRHHRRAHCRHHSVKA